MQRAPENAYYHVSKKNASTWRRFFIDNNLKENINYRFREVNHTGFRVRQFAYL